MAYGFLSFIKINVWYAIVFGPIIVIMVLNKLYRYTIQIFYPRFDIAKHEKFVNDYWATHSEPAVDIFLPYAGEDLSVHEEVVKGATQLNYTNYKVYMLDDSTNHYHKGLAEKYSCIHLSRPNKGEWKKSGNLEYGYSHSTGKFIFILDADFIPAKDALRDAIPYIDSDNEIGILQTPQYFEQTDQVHKRSRIEFGGGNIVEDFYRIIQPCRDEFNAATCVGTSAVYRRDAIEKLNGTPKVHASEDLATGLLVTKYGYHVKYIPLIISIGTSPDTYQGYFKQHQRWCSGNLVFAEYWPTAHMSPIARLIFLMSPTYYVSEALSILFSFQFLILLYFNLDHLSIYNTLFFIPYMILSKVIVPINKINKDKTGTRLAALNNSYTYLYTFLSMTTRRMPQWHPTGLKIKGIHPDFLTANKIGILISSFLISSYTYVLITRPQIFGNYNTYAVLLWSMYTIFWHTIYLTSVGTYIHPIQLATVENFLGKVNIYARTHVILILFAVLSAAFVCNTYIASKNPNSLTAVAVSNAMEGKFVALLDPVINDDEVSTNSLSTPNTNDTIPTTNVAYSYEVHPDDTPKQIAEQTIDQFLSQQKYQLTTYQKEVATELLTTSLQLQAIPGNKISIDQDKIEGSVQTAMHLSI